MAVSKNFVVKNGLEVGGDTLFANSVTDRVGIGTTNPTSNFTVKGNTSLEDLTVSGVSTFSNNVAIGTSIPISTLTVAGSGTSTSQLFVAGVSTFHNNAFIASDNRLYFGAETLSISFQSTPSVSNYIETFDHVPLNIVTENLTVGASDGETYANFKINSSVSLFYDNAKKFETSGLGVTVTGVTSTTYLYATGISTFITGPVFIGSGTTTGTAEQKLQVTGGGYFSSPVGIGITNPSNTLTVVGSGTSTAQLYVTGFSTFVGYSTFLDYVNIEDGLYVAGVSTFVGYSTFEDYVEIQDGLNVSGVSTFVGYSTFRDYVNIEDGLNVSGISTFFEYSTFEDYVEIQDGLNVSGVSTFVGYSTFRDYVNIEDGLNVSGVSTFVGYSAFEDYVEIQDGLNVSGVSTFVGYSTFRDYVNIEDGLNVSGVSTFVGFSTFQDYVDIQNGLNVSGASTLIGSVGIGSTIPTSKLTVDGDVNISGIVTAPTFVGNLTGTATTATTVDILNTNGLSTVYYPTFVESRTDGQIVRADVDLTYRTDDNVLTVPNINLSSSGLTVGTGGTVVTTTDSGRVGLGTINPVSKLSVVGGDASVGINTSQGVILTSPNGTRYRLFVENDGTLKTFAV